jgi:TatD DNase family protein
MFSESHCHLRHVSPQTIKTAEDLNFKYLLTTGIDLISSEIAINTAKRYDIVKACIGIHPWYANEFDGGAGCVLENLAIDPEVVAISEIGLDYVGRRDKDFIPEDRYIEKDIQRGAFRGQINIAKELELPILVHDRTPDEEVLDIIEDTGIHEVGAAIHGFSKNLDYASRCVDMGVYLSIGLRSIQNPSKELIYAINEIPIEYLLTETDSDDPRGILELCESLSEIKGLESEKIGSITTQNLERFLNL